MFIPRVRLNYNKEYTGWQQASSRQKRLRERRPFRLSDFINIPCLLPALLGTLIGSLVSIGGITMSVIGYYPDNLATSLFVHSTKVARPEPAKNGYLKILAYIGPVLMGLGTFTVIVSCVMYCEFRDKYLRVQTETKMRAMNKGAVYELVVEQFRKNYFRGIQLPLPDRNHKKTFADASTNKSDSNTSMLMEIKEDEFSSGSCKISLQGESHFYYRVQPIDLYDIGQKACSMPNIKPFHSASHLSLPEHTSNVGGLHTCRLSKSCDAVPNVCMISNGLIGGSSTGIINPAYVPDEDRINRYSDSDSTCRNSKYLFIHQSRSVSEGDSQDGLPVVIVHQASVHQVDTSRRNSGNTYYSGGSSVHSDNSSLPNKDLLSTDGDQCRSTDSRSPRSIFPFQETDQQGDGDSSNITDDMMQHFEMTDVTHK